MSEIDSQQEGLQESQKNSETASPALSHLEAHQNQLPSKGLELNTTETNVDQNSKLLLHLSENKAEGIDLSPIDSKNQELPETFPTNAPPDFSQTHSEPIITTADPSATFQDPGTLSSSQPPPLNLETIYEEMRLLRQDMQEGIRKLQSSIDSLIEEVAVLKQQPVTTDLPIEQTDQKRKQTQPNNLVGKKKQDKQARNNKLDFHAVMYLKEHGEIELHKELKEKANTELIQISRSLGIKIGQSSKTIEREEMIKEILLQAERRLKAGSVFLKGNKDASET